MKAPDVEILYGSDCGLRVLKGTIVPSTCSCNFLTGTAFPLVPPEFKHWLRPIVWSLSSQIYNIANSAGMIFLFMLYVRNKTCHGLLEMITNKCTRLKAVCTP